MIKVVLDNMEFLDTRPADGSGGQRSYSPRRAGSASRAGSPQPPMPNISLSRQQIDDIVAYLGTLPAE